MKRLFYGAAMIAVVGSLLGSRVRADDSTVVIRAQGNANLIDFESRKEKNPYWRIAVVTKGLDGAFTEWLRAERPHLFKQYAEQQAADPSRESRRFSLRVRADETFVIHADGNPNLIDFESRKEKNAYWRIAIVKKGLDGAFTEWLQAERPHLYKRYLEKQSGDESRAPHRIDSPIHVDGTSRTIRAEGNPNLIDFQSRGEKNAYWRIAIVKKGLDGAFTEWLRAEKPHLYKQYAADQAARK